MPGTPLRLAELTWEEAQALQRRAPLCLLPIGATEAHGPHLPLCTDVLLSEELAARVARSRPEQLTLILPSLPYAVTEFGAPFPGTVSLSPETATALYTDVLTGLHRSGFSRVCLVNSHLEAAHVACLRAACQAAQARSGHKVAFPDHTERRFARTLTEEYRRGNCHAGRYETSLLLAGRPDLVRDPGGLQKNEADFLAAVKRGASTFPEAGGPHAYFGDPASATRQEGEATYDLLVQMVWTSVSETWPAAA